VAPDGFYFGDISIAFHSETLIRKNFNILSVASVGLYNNFDELKLASDSIIEHVRTDIVKYLKSSDKYHITRLQANYFINPYKSIYAKLSAGIFEPMFAGYGGELLYKPFDETFAVGAELWKVRQRSYRQLLGFREYSTLTGHLIFTIESLDLECYFMLRQGVILQRTLGLHLISQEILKVV
jgi:hypothetical protein